MDLKIPVSFGSDCGVISSVADDENVVPMICESDVETYATADECVSIVDGSKSGGAIAVITNPGSNISVQTAVDERVSVVMSTSPRPMTPVTPEDVADYPESPKSAPACIVFSSNSGAIQPEVAGLASPIPIDAVPGEWKYTLPNAAAKFASPIPAITISDEGSHISPIHAEKSTSPIPAITISDEAKPGSPAPAAKSTSPTIAITAAPDEAKTTSPTPADDDVPEELNWKSFVSTAFHKSLQFLKKASLPNGELGDHGTLEGVEKCAGDVAQCKMKLDDERRLVNPKEASFGIVEKFLNRALKEVNHDDLLSRLVSLWLFMDNLPESAYGYKKAMWNLCMAQFNLCFELGFNKKRNVPSDKLTGSLEFLVQEKKDGDEVLDGKSSLPFIKLAWDRYSRVTDALGVSGTFEILERKAGVVSELRRALENEWEMLSKPDKFKTMQVENALKDVLASSQFQTLLDALAALKLRLAELPVGTEAYQNAMWNLCISKIGLVTEQELNRKREAIHRSTAMEEEAHIILESLDYAKHREPDNVPAAPTVADCAVASCGNQT
jgi:hypothetical protein